MLAVDRINTFYGETQALFDVSLSVKEGEAIALLGPNGAGKTSTLRSILGLTPARSGDIIFNNRPITRVPTHQIARSGIGWVPEDRRVFPSLNVRSNLAIAQKRSPFRAWTLEECFGLFSALEHLMDRDCENLSGGEMQMVAVSRALMGGPGLVLMDEPSQGLAPKLVQDVMKAIRRIADEGISVVVVEQHPMAVLEVVDRAYVLNKGILVHEGTADELKADEARRRELVGA
jgi:branched-chain amino acid transport system ATP-binding protein